MTTSHIFYIPLVLLAGLVLGIMLGRRSVVMAAEDEARRNARREVRRRALAELEAQEDQPTPEGPEAGDS